MGFNNIPIDELVELSIHHVTPRFIHEMRRQYGENLSLSQLLECASAAWMKTCWRSYAPQV
jgi:hypothetical protein